MKTKIAVIDYGMGNLRSVSKALELCGADVKIITSAEEIKDYNSVVLPGVGAFAPAIKIIKEKGFDIEIQNHVAKNRMILGICLGFQLFFTESNEDGIHKGLDLIKGKVTKFIAKPNENLIIPHMGWNNIVVSDKNIYAKQMYNGIDDGAFVYFVHSYYCTPEDKTITATETDYSVKFCSSIATKNIWGCQFHPEKSSDTGLKILKNFVLKCEE